MSRRPCNKSSFQHVKIKHWALSAVGMTLRCEVFLDITQDRKVLAAAETHLIVQIFAANLYIFTFKRHIIIVATLGNIANVKGTLVEAGCAGGKATV